MKKFCERVAVTMLWLYDENNRDIMNELSSSDCCSNPSCLQEPWSRSINRRGTAAVVGWGGVVLGDAMTAIFLWQTLLHR